MSRLVASAVALALLHPAAALAATDPELEEIRAQIRELKSSYEARIQALEQRLKDAEARAAAPPVAAPPVAASPPPAVAPPPSASAPSSGLAAFNPAISAILAGSYNNFSLDPRQYRLSGFLTPDGIGPGDRGFSLGESELTFSANVDHKFAGVLTFSVSPQDTVEVEEAFGTFNGAPYGVVPKFGRFLSAAGYLNEQHAHAWDFADTPLAYQAFLGGQYRTDGAQLRWVAPTDQYLELGGELGNGNAFPGAPRNHNGAGAGLVFARTGGDIGESHNWLAGLSYLDTHADARNTSAVGVAGDTGTAIFTGHSHTAGVQAVWKWAPNGNPLVHNFKLQAEYFWRRESGELAFVRDAPFAIAAPAAYSSRQSGGYVQ
ncbi:MAG TPA: hypothetical protein VFJ62_16700, partial [Usitatibacter sp.]|nr:hypothetical protein [Usitatibacter sp.]